MLQPSSNSGKLFSGDLVFIKYLNNQLINLIVTEDKILDDLDMSLKVRRPQGNSSVDVASVKLEQLVKDGENIVAVPCNMYQIDGDGSIELDESISYMFDALMNKEIDENALWWTLFAFFLKIAQMKHYFLFPFMVGF